MRAATHAIVIDSPVGHLELSETGGHLTHCGWTTKTLQDHNGKHISAVLQNAILQLEEYFKAKRLRFDLPLAPAGTPFQQTVWRTLAEIPYGETRSYQQLARSVGRAKAFRAVGSANGKNPLCIIIPCHRVIRASGELGGYAGGLGRKIKLLHLEKSGNQ
jgi:methylated-DNA-[protein]-cysteine S-methyltransferase